MKWLRVCVSVLLSGVVGGVVLVWPVLPVWTVTLPEEARIQRFSRDGRELITTHFDPGPQGPAYANRWDVRTGRLLTRVEFEEMKGKGPYQFYRMMDDGRT